MGCIQKMKKIEIMMSVKRMFERKFVPNPKENECAGDKINPKDRHTALNTQIFM